MMLVHGSIQKRLLWTSFQPDRGGKRIPLTAQNIPDSYKKELHSSSRVAAVWVLFDDNDQVAEIAASIDSFTDETVFRYADQIATFCRSMPAEYDESIKLDLLKCVLGDERYDDSARLAIIASKSNFNRLCRCVGALPRRLYSSIIETLSIRETWLDISHDLPGSLTDLSAALFELDEYVRLKEERNRLIVEREAERRALEEKRKREEEERRRAQEEELRRIEEERLRIEAEDRRRAAVQRERESAFRKALEKMRSPADSGEIEVNKEFLRVFELVEGGEKFLFVTGKPGTGKSTLIRALRERLSSTSVVVLSPTGMAALAVGGQTIHSFFQFPLHILEEGYATTSWTFKKKARAMEVLVIDEVSMVRADILDAIDCSLRAARGDDRPFGGVRVVLSGDLYQIPPILERDENAVEYYRARYGEKRFFDAAAIVVKHPPRLVELEKVYRQKDAEFLDFLRKVRDGTISGDELDSFNTKIKNLFPFENADFCIYVSPHNAPADAHNERMLSELPGETVRYQAVLEGKTERVEKNPPAPKDLALKKGAQVMLIKNDRGRRWMNGDIGMVEELKPASITVRCRSGVYEVGPEAWPIIEYDQDKATNRLSSNEVGSFLQFPLKPAWATTIHKMQGQTVDRITIDLGAGAFETGMSYVALSRCRTMEGIRLSRPLVKADLSVDGTIAGFLSSLRR